MVSIIVPIHNEATALSMNSAILLSGLPDFAQIVFVCNGCTDDSVDILSKLQDPRVMIMQLPQAGKAAAINAAESECWLFPRFYIDADVTISGGDLARLALQLDDEAVELVAPKIQFDQTGASWAARAFNNLWLQLPHGQHEAFQQVIGVSRAGRGRWHELPLVTADDSFMLSMVPTARRRIISDVVAIVRPPRTIGALIGTRIRILRGLNELRSLGYDRPRAVKQRAAFLRALLTPKLMPAALVYLAVIIAANTALLLGLQRGTIWYRDNTSRSSSSTDTP